MCIALLLVTYTPAISLWLPRADEVRMGPSRPREQILDVVSGGGPMNALKPGLRLGAIVSAVVISVAALAQAWPAKPIKLIVGFPTGGASDAMARMLIAKMELV